MGLSIHERGESWMPIAVTYEKDKRDRVVLARALITPPFSEGQRTDPRVDPPGFKNRGGLLNEARCHIIGAQLGGSNTDPDNFFWGEHDPFNTPDMRHIENVVANVAKANRTIEYIVRLQYTDADREYAFQDYIYYAPVWLYFEAYANGQPLLPEETRVFNPLGLRGDIDHLPR